MELIGTSARQSGSRTRAGSSDTQSSGRRDRTGEDDSGSSERISARGFAEAVYRIGLGTGHPAGATAGLLAFLVVHRGSGPFDTGHAGHRGGAIPSVGLRWLRPFRRDD